MVHCSCLTDADYIYNFHVCLQEAQFAKAYICTAVVLIMSCPVHREVKAYAAAARAVDSGVDCMQTCLRYAHWNHQAFRTTILPKVNLPSHACHPKPCNAANPH